MQDITFYVSAAETLGVLCDSDNSFKTAKGPTLVIGAKCCLKMRLFATRGNKDPYPIDSFADVTAWQWAMDDDFDSSTVYKLVGDNAAISVQSLSVTIDDAVRTVTEVSIPMPNMATQEVIDYIGKAESNNTLNGELCGYNDDGELVFILQVKGFTIRNRITSVGNPTVIEPDYLNEAQVRALLAEATRPAKGDTGASAYEDAVANGYVGTLEQWLASLHGKDGKDGINGINGKDGVDGINGVDGKDGKDGTNGVNGKDGAVGPKGDIGEGLQIDITDELRNRYQYDYSPVGFRYLATDIHTDSAGREYQEWYQKQSVAAADWSAGVRLYTGQGAPGKDGKDGENVKVIAPIEFRGAYDADAPLVPYIYGGGLTIKSTDPIASVETLTEIGKYATIPLNSTAGVERMVINTVAGTTTLQFGADVVIGVGRIRFAQGVGETTLYQRYLEGGGNMSEKAFEKKLFSWIGTAILTGTDSYQLNGKTGDTVNVVLDAVSKRGDEVTYAVTSGALPPGITLQDGVLSGSLTTIGNYTAEITATAGAEVMTITVSSVVVANTTMYYGYINDGTTYRVADVTADMLTAGTVTTTSAAALGKTAINAPAGALVVVLIPASSALVARKDDGLGGKVVFDIDNGAASTGTNGAVLTIGGVAYKAYGEFNLVNAATYIYIEEA